MLSFDEIDTVFQQHYFEGMGSITRGDAKFLSGLIQASQPHKCFEVGVASGMSTTFLLMALAKLGPERKLVSVDISRQYYADRTKQVGYVVDQAIPDLGCEFELHFNQWSADAETFCHDAKFDFAFIDAHHSHPWPTLDTMLLLPLVASGTWIACHDIALKDIPRFAKETGPFHIYQAFPEPKKKSTLERKNIGAFQINRRHQEYEEALLASLAQEWTVSGVIKKSFYDRIYQMVDQYYSESFAKEIRRMIEAHNLMINERRAKQKAAKQSKPDG